MGLCVLALFLTTTKAQAMDEPCDSQRAACASHCGTDVTYGFLYHFWDPFHSWGWIWDEGTQDWYEGWIADWTDVNGYIIGPGVDYWECVPGEGTGGHGICQCRY